MSEFTAMLNKSLSILEKVRRGRYPSLASAGLPNAPSKAGRPKSNQQKVEARAAKRTLERTGTNPTLSVSEQTPEPKPKPAEISKPVDLSVGTDKKENVVPEQIDLTPDYNSIPSLFEDYKAEQEPLNIPKEPVKRGRKKKEELVPSPAKRIPNAYKRREDATAFMTYQNKYAKSATNPEFINAIEAINYILSNGLYEGSGEYKLSGNTEGNKASRYQIQVSADPRKGNVYVNRVKIPARFNREGTPIGINSEQLEELATLVPKFERSAILDSEVSALNKLKSNLSRIELYNIPENKFVLNQTPSIGKSIEKAYKEFTGRTTGTSGGVNPKVYKPKKTEEKPVETPVVPKKKGPTMNSTVNGQHIGQVGMTTSLGGKEADASFQSNSEDYMLEKAWEEYKKALPQWVKEAQEAEKYANQGMRSVLVIDDEADMDELEREYSYHIKNPKYDAKQKELARQRLKLIRMKPMPMEESKDL